MGKLFGMLGALVTAVCIGTLLAQLIAVAWLWQRGVLTHDSLVAITAILQGVDRDAARSTAAKDQEPSQASQVSLVDVARARALRSRDLELREQALRNYHE